MHVNPVGLMAETVRETFPVNPLREAMEISVEFEIPTGTDSLVGEAATAKSSIWYRTLLEC